MPNLTHHLLQLHGRHWTDPDAFPRTRFSAVAEFPAEKGAGPLAGTMIGDGQEHQEEPQRKTA